MWCRAVSSITLAAMMLGLAAKAIGQQVPGVDPRQDLVPLRPAMPPGAAPQGPAMPDGAAVAPMPAAGPAWAPGAHEHGGPRVGSPYYWSGQHHRPGWTGMGPAYGPPAGHGAPWSSAACGCQHRTGGWEAYAGGGLPGYGQPVYGTFGGHGGWGGYGGWGGWGGNPYVYHFGAGFHRHSSQGHYRFPYYNYRSPWYSPGPPSFNRDTNFPW